jgi:hypothetical protein
MTTPNRRTPAKWKTFLNSSGFIPGTSESREDYVAMDLRRRLKGVCEQLSSEDFEILIRQMTREQLRGERAPVPTIP